MVFGYSLKVSKTGGKSRGSEEHTVMAGWRV
jgi:hypothetical protein